MTRFVDEPTLVKMIQDPAIKAQAWAEHAACLEQSIASDAYFPGDDDVPPMEALACCGSCPVKSECLATALAHEAVDGNRHGWWGGLGPADRDVLSIQLDVAAGVPRRIDIGEPVASAKYLRARRYTVHAIAVELGCSERAVYRYLAASAA